jgi:anaerobic ribonucleoside-triphosphate reductase activating protein
MVKGISRQVILVHGPDTEMFEQAIFILKENTGEVTDEMLSYINVLVDGRFVKELKNIRLRFRGSENQRLIDMDQTRAQGEIVLWDEAQ